MHRGVIGLMLIRCWLDLWLLVSEPTTIYNMYSDTVYDRTYYDGGVS